MNYKHLFEIQCYFQILKLLSIDIFAYTISCLPESHINYPLNFTSSLCPSFKSSPMRIEADLKQRLQGRVIRNP